MFVVHLHLDMNVTDKKLDRQMEALSEEKSKNSNSYVN